MPKKLKRKIIVNDRIFYWFVAEDIDDVLWLGARPTLTIYSQDKKFVVKYPFVQNVGLNHLVVLGKEFGGDGEFGKIYKRVVTPSWEVEGAITPGSVRSIIEWSLEKKIVTFVNYQGEEIEANV